MMTSDNGLLSVGSVEDVLAEHDVGRDRSEPVHLTRKRSRFLNRIGVEGASLLAGLGIWYVIGEYFSARLVPTPIVVAQTLWSLAGTGSLERNIGASLERVLIGFLLGLVAAVPVGFITGWYSIANRIAEPWIQFFRTIPPIALIPLIIVYLGIGKEAQTSVIFFAVFLTVVITVHQGVRHVDATLIRAARVLGVEKNSKLFRYVILPSALPHIFVGIRLGLAGAWTTLIAAELIAAQHGLGYMIQVASTLFEIPVVYAGIFTIGVLGFTMDRLVLIFYRRISRWQDVGEK